MAPTLAAAATRTNVGANSSGLVVCSEGPSGSGAATGCNPDQHLIDSSGTDEDVKFTFLSEVTLLSMTVTHWSNTDDFSLFVGGTVRGTDIRKFLVREAPGPILSLH